MEDESITIENRIVGQAEPVAEQSPEQPDAKVEAFDPYQNEVIEEVSTLVDGKQVDAEESTPEAEEPPKVAAATEEELPKSVQKRINKYAREKKEADERAWKAEQERLFVLQQLQQFQGGTQAQPQRDPYAPIEPQENDPKYIGNDKAYFRDYVKFQKDSMVYESQKNNAQRYQQDVETKYQNKVNEARDKYDDFDETIASLNNYPAINGHANVNNVITAIRELDNGPDVAYYLTKNPAEFIEILNKTPLKAAMELGRRSSLLEQPMVKNVKPTSPPPIKNINGSGAPPKSKKHFSELSLDEMETYFRSNP